MHQRRQFLKTSASIAALGAGFPVAANAYPTRPVRWVVPFPAGGPVDIVARRAADLLAAKVGQAIVVDNKPGASGAIGTTEVARAKPDGYTLGLATTDSLVSVMFLQKTPGYDTRKDLSLIGKLCYSQQLLVVPASSGIRDIQGLVAAAKAKPEGISFASWGAGSIPHLYMKSLESAAGIKLLHVPYKGLAPALQDLLSGQINVALVPPGAALPYEKKGSINVISVSGGDRLPQLPKVATIQQQGMDAPMFRYTYWAGMVGPRGLPPEVLALWSKLVIEVQSMPEFTSVLVPLGMLPSGRTGAQFAEELSQEYEIIGKLIQELGVKPE